MCRINLFFYITYREYVKNIYFYSKLAFHQKPAEFTVRLLFTH